MWFKNLYLFKFEKDFALSAEELHDELSKHPFTPCSPTQRESLGWVPPLGSKTNQEDPNQVIESSFTHSSSRNILMTMARQERILPAAVIKEELEEKIAEIEEREARKVTSREKKDLKEDIEQALLPRAFTRTQKIDAWLDPKNGWLLINTPSAPRAEAFTVLLRKALGSLPVVLPDSEISPAVAMTQWLNDEAVPVPFMLGEECELKNQGEEKGTATFKQQELTCEEIKTSLQSGKTASKLSLVWDDKIQFVLTDDLQIKKLKFLDVMEEQLSDSDPQTHAEHLDIEFALMTGEVSVMLRDLMKVLN